MAPAPDSPDRPPRATSSEPGSTRANPFDDTDASSRKRRRTTASSSPIRSRGSLERPDSSDHMSTTADGPAADLSASTDALSNAPRTPDRQMSSTDPSSEPPSSKVTINLRKARPSDTMSSSSSPSARPEDAAAPVTRPKLEADEPQESVELPEGSISQAAETKVDVSTPSSLDSSTPSMEILAGIDEDNDMAYDGLNGDAAVTDNGQVWEDPITRFPYTDEGENACDTIQTLVHYISTNTKPDESVIDQVAQWTESYLAYVRQVDRRAAFEGFRASRAFWLSFPEVLLAMMSRRPSLHSFEPLRHYAMRFYSAFAQLTAGFVGLDRATLDEYDASSTLPNRGPPDLFSLVYLHNIHLLLRRDEPELEKGQLVATAADVDRLDDVSFLVVKLVSAPGGSLRSLRNLATGLVELIPNQPKLAYSLAPVCKVVGDVLREARRNLVLGQQEAFHTKENLELGHDLWRLLSTSLSNTVEKHVSSLTSDSTACQIQAMTEILRICLHGDHKLAATTTSDHRQRYPQLSHDFTFEAIAWEWRFDVLDKLIRSSQMQLRVMAVTTMCNELVNVWKRFSETGDEEGKSFLRHIGEYLLDNNLVEYILSPNCHPEIVVESANIVGFLVVTELYRPEHTDQLWHGITSSQNPRVADALARMITTITNLFSYPNLLGLCQKLQTLPIDGFNPSVRMLWDNVLRQMVGRCSAGQAPLTFHPYDLCLRLLRESSVCVCGSQVAYPEIQHSAMQKFKELLGYGPDSEGRLMLYRSCIDDISARSPTTLGSLSCLSMAIRPGLAAELSILTEQHDLARLIVEELEHAVVAGQAEGVPAVLSGIPNSPRRDFVANIIHLQPASIDNQLGERLWNILVGPQSPCQDDRNAGWQIMIGVLRQVSLDNPFLQAAFSRYLPTLPPACFCEGMHGFVREHVLSLVESSNEFLFDDEVELAHSGIEQLWRIILAADDVGIVDLAIRTLALEVYIESRSIKSYPFHRTRQVHLSLVNRCLRQLGEAARKIRSFNEENTSGDGESMVVVESEDQTRQQERIFTRSLKLLRYFLEAHQSKPSFAAPDLRSFMSQAPQEIEGDPAQLKYQSFDGTEVTNVRPLSIGKLNTAASLLASLKEETGFPNYRVYYRGRLFHPSERDICKSLEDLCIHEGLILVKREEDGVGTSARIRPGSSSLEIEILSHFDEMWEFLSMDAQLAKEIYDFLVKLPADGHVVDLFESSSPSHRDIFPPGQPFKSLYAVHAVVEHAEACRLAATASSLAPASEGTSRQEYVEVLRKSTSVVVGAISDKEVVGQASKILEMQLTASLMNALVKLLQEFHESSTPIGSATVGGLEASRLVDILSSAADAAEPDAFSLVMSTTVVICRRGLADLGFWQSITPNPAFVELVRRFSLSDPRKHARISFLRIVDEALQAEDRIASDDASDDANDSVNAPRPLAQFFWSVASDLILKTVEFPDQSHEVFRVFHSLLMLVSNRVPAVVDLRKLARQASQLLLDHTSTERVGNIDPDDPIASGFTSTLHLCLQMDESLPASDSLPTDLAHDLFWTHLFPQQRSHTASSVQRVVLNSDTRAKLCDIVFRLVCHDRLGLAMLLGSMKELVPYYENDHEEPYLYELPCQFDRLKAIRAPCGYVGLRNLSNTCYLNSLLTQLFMNTTFRRFLLGCQTQNPAESHLLFLTQKLFGFMQESYRRYVDPTELVSSIKTYDDTPIDIHSQMDVDEFYNLLFDRWESQLTTDNAKKRLRSFYGGQLVQQVKSKECEHISERLEPFSAIQCDIKGKTTLQESLQAYVDGEIMEGENKYKCSTCDRHVDAVKRACFKDLPDSLIFHLKRFDFNLRTLQRSKINDYFAFPEKIDLLPYTVEHLSDTGADGNADVFELVGVLVHSGTAESGHYYSYIKERPTSHGRHGWVEFNDDIVSPWDHALMESSTFGGFDHRPAYETNGIAYDKSYSAYMLFYQRVSTLEAEQQALSERDIAAPVRCDMDVELREHIFGENTVLLRRHCIFDPSHAAFVQRCFSQAKILDEKHETGSEPDKSEHELKDLAMETAVGHLDQVVSRAKDIPQFPTFAAKVEDAIVECADCALAFYDYLVARCGAFRAMLQRNPEPVVRYFAGRGLLRALKKISAEIPYVYGATTSASSDDGESEARRARHLDRETPVVRGALDLFNWLWRYFHIHIRSWDEYFGTVVEFARLGHQEVAHLLAGDYLLKLLRIIAADASMELPANYARMLHSILRRVNSRQPSYVAVIKTIEYLLRQLEPRLGPGSITEAEDERLEQPMPPFSWTSEEVQFIHDHPEREPSSFFVEKLIGLDKAHGETCSILARLVKTGSRMDMKVGNAIVRGLDLATTSQPVEPYLRAAGTFLENTGSSHLARVLVEEVSEQAKHLQGPEGVLFVRFFEGVNNLQHPDEGLKAMVRRASLSTVPGWAPYLLVDRGWAVRQAMRRFLADEVFTSPARHGVEEGAEEEERAEWLMWIRQRLGFSCLEYLRDAHIRRRAQISQEAAESILVVIENCAPFYDAEAETADDEVTEFASLQSEVLLSLRGLIVDELEDNGSEEWNGSGASSDQMVPS